LEGVFVDVLSRVTDVFREVFDDEELTVARETTAADVSGWDSLMHVRLVLALEKAFGVRFSSSEVASLANVGELVDVLDRKVTSQGMKN
jgi:acyl carrier protein